MYSQPMPALNKPKPKQNPNVAAARLPFVCCHCQNNVASEKTASGNSEKGAKPGTASKPRQKAVMNLCAEMNFTENYRRTNPADYMGSPKLFKIGWLKLSLKIRSSFKMQV